jgi:hypothetical protein
MMVKSSQNQKFTTFLCCFAEHGETPKGVSPFFDFVFWWIVKAFASSITRSLDKIPLARAFLFGFHFRGNTHKKTVRSLDR